MDIPSIKNQLRLTSVLAHYGIKMDRNKRVICPWHNDKTPSLQIYPATDTWCCFSTACQAGTGDAIQFIQNMERCTKAEAIAKAKELIGVVKTGSRFPVRFFLKVKF